MVIVTLEALAKFICSLCVVFERSAQSDIERDFFSHALLLPLIQTPWGFSQNNFRYC